MHLIEISSKFIKTNCRLSHPTILYEDNNACISQIQVDFVKGDRIKYIDSKYFSYAHDLITKPALEIKKVISTKNLIDLFTKALPLCIHRCLVYDIGMW